MHRRRRAYRSPRLRTPAMRATRSPSSQMTMPFGPSVTARKRADVFGDAAQGRRRDRSSRWCRARLRPKTITCVPSVNSGSSEPRRLVDIDHHRHVARRARRLADRRHEFGKTVVDQHRVDVRRRVCPHPPAARWPSLTPRRVAMVRSPCASMKISDTDAVPPVDAHDAAAIDALGARDRRRMRSLDRVVGAAERAGEARRAAQPRDRHCGIGGAAAAVTMNSEASTLVPGAGKFSTRMTLSCTAMPAQKICGAVIAQRQPKPISRSTQARMM